MKPGDEGRIASTSLRRRRASPQLKQQKGRGPQKVKTDSKDGLNVWTDEEETETETEEGITFQD